MNNTSKTFGTKLMARLGIQFAETGWKPSHVKQLTESPELCKQLLWVVHGCGHVTNSSQSKQPRIDIDYSVGQMSELKMCLEQTGWTPDDIERLASNAILCSQTLEMLGKKPMISFKGDYADLSAQPLRPNNWMHITDTDDHVLGPIWKHDSSQLQLWQSDRQKEGPSEPRYRYMEMVLELNPVSANLLDYYIHNQDRIPDEWKLDSYSKPRKIFFLGTEYHEMNEYDEVYRYMEWSPKKKEWSDHYIRGIVRFENDSWVVMFRPQQ